MRRLKIPSLTVLAFGLTLGSACLQPIDGLHEGDDTNQTDPNDPDPNDPDPNDPDPNDPDPNDPDPNDPDPNDPDPNDPDPNDPVEPVDPGTAQPYAWCAPLATPATPSLNLPEIPPEALEPECALVEVGATSNATSTSSSTVYIRRDDGLWVILPRGGYADLLHVVYQDGARVEARYGQRHPLGGFRFSGYEPIQRFRWDTAGHLLESASVENGREDIYLSQAWDGDRLVHRTEQRNNVAAGELVRETMEIDWFYQSGRLSRVAAKGYGHAFGVTWTYDDAWRPTSVERTRDGVVVERLTWRYDAANHVAERTVLLDQRFLSEDGFDPAGLDDHGAAVGWVYDTNPWPRSVPRRAASGCMLVPTSVSHGYPAEEGEYDLLAPLAERPAGLGWAYGNNSYGWDYGDKAWYSHAGIHGLETSLPSGAHGQRVESRLTYRAGRMSDERVSSLPPLADSSDVTGTHERQRELVDGALAADRLVLALTFPGTPHSLEGSARHDRELRFLRDAQGHLVGRELHDASLGLLERQLWQRDARGRWLTHEIGQPSSLAPIYFYPGAGGCAEGSVCPESDPRTWRRYERELDAQGRAVVLREAYVEPDGDISGEPQETRSTWDDGGRLIAVQQHGSVHRWHYDAAGLLYRETWDWTGDGEPEQWEDTAYDERGRWIHRQFFYEGTPGQASFRTFDCD